MWTESSESCKGSLQDEFLTANSYHVHSVWLVVALAFDIVASSGTSCMKPCMFVHDPLGGMRFRKANDAGNGVCEGETGS